MTIHSIIKYRVYLKFVCIQIKLKLRSGVDWESGYSFAQDDQGRHIEKMIYEEVRQEDLGRKFPGGGMTASAKALRQSAG